MFETLSSLTESDTADATHVVCSLQCCALLSVTRCWAMAVLKSGWNCQQVARVKKRLSPDSKTDSRMQVRKQIPLYITP